METTVRSAFMRDFPVTLLADCCAAKTRRLHDLSIEVLTSYELAEIARVSEGYDCGSTTTFSPVRRAPSANASPTSPSPNAFVTTLSRTGRAIRFPRRPQAPHATTRQ